MRFGASGLVERRLAARGAGLRRRRLGLRRRRARRRARAPSGPRPARQLRPARGRRRGRGGLPRELCAALRIDLHVERPARRWPATSRPPRARVRYDAAERAARSHRRRLDRHRPHPHRRRRDRALPARGLAGAPGAARARAAQRARGPARCSALERERVARAGASRPALPFADDETNDDPRFARNRIRAEVLPVLRELSPAAEPQHRRDPRRARRGGAAARAGRARGARRGRRRRRRGGDRRPRRSTALRARRCAGSRCGRSPSAPPAARSRSGRARAAEICASRGAPEGGEVELGGGLVARSASRASSAFAPAPPTPRPSRSRCGSRAGRGSARWEVRAELAPGPGGARRAPTWRRSTPRALGGRLEVRTWREGDRIRPLGMDGTKTLAGPVHRPRRAALAAPPSCRSSPSTATIAWVAGVAVSEDFRLEPERRARSRC